MLRPPEGGHALYTWLVEPLALRVIPLQRQLSCKGGSLVLVVWVVFNQDFLKICEFVWHRSIFPLKIFVLASAWYALRCLAITWRRAWAHSKFWKNWKIAKTSKIIEHTSNSYRKSCFRYLGVPGAQVTNSTWLVEPLALRVIPLQRQLSCKGGSLALMV